MTPLERYEKNVPKGHRNDPNRGTERGRPNINPRARPRGPLTACHVELDGEGYDVCGIYWGPVATERLYFVHGTAEDGGDIELFVWADNILVVRFVVYAMGQEAASVELGEWIECPEVKSDDGADVTCDAVDNAHEWAQSEWEDHGWALVDALAEQHAPEALPAALSDAIYGMCLRACDRGAGVQDLAESLLGVVKRLNSSDEGVVRDQRGEGDAALWGTS